MSVGPSIFFILFGVVFVGVFVFVFFVIAKSIGGRIAENRRNAASPVERRPAKVVTKRTNVWGDHSRTSYYVTFEFADGARLEFNLSGEQYGHLAEGDVGGLSHQGTKYLGFERQRA